MSNPFMNLSSKLLKTLEEITLNKLSIMSLNIFLSFFVSPIYT